MTLLKDPSRGLSLITEMFNQALASVIESSFWTQRKELYHSDADSMEDLKMNIIAGFNYPPSQYQLHLQFMIPPFLPFQYFMCKKGMHFTEKRFFPLEYVQAVLRCSSHFDFAENPDVEQLFEFYKKNHQIDYYEFHAKMTGKYYASHEKLSNWESTQFNGVISESGDFYPFKNTEGDLDLDFAEKLSSAERDSVAAADKMILQNYGRPYSAENKPSGTYYKYAKESLEFF